MTEPKPGFVKRLAIAISAFLRALSDADFAAGVARLQRGEAPAAPAPEAKPAPVALKETRPESALQLLGLLQQEGRFIDFLQEEVTGYSDAEIGGAARVVHEGCRKALRNHLSVEPIRTESENTRVTVQEGFDAASIRLVGNVVGKPPFTGTLVHKGWQAAEIKLPKLAEGHNVRVLQPAEVEL